MKRYTMIKTMKLRVKSKEGVGQGSERYLVCGVPEEKPKISYKHIFHFFNKQKHQEHNT